MTESAPRHPDGMFLVLPTVGLQVSERLAAANGGSRLSPEEAFSAIGAIGLDTAQALASQRGELRHAAPLDEESWGQESVSENEPGAGITEDIKGDKDE
ncbi:hypothetical protein [Muribaculum intestinale]|uniref:hypothetical protein n=1 Tax=Muribaculum intestinale TaxID=1796646 RepID=UPI0025A94D77|nr:hypothetical protein [Muribaculum intestinale]